MTSNYFQIFIMKILFLYNIIQKWISKKTQINLRSMLLGSPVFTLDLRLKKKFVNVKIVRFKIFIIKNLINIRANLLFIYLSLNAIFPQSKTTLPNKRGTLKKPTLYWIGISIAICTLPYAINRRRFSHWRYDRMSPVLGSTKHNEGENDVLNFVNWTHI